MARKPQTAIGLELGARLVTLVAYDIPHRQVQLVAMENAPQGWRENPSLLGEMLKDWLGTLGLDKKTSALSACVSAHDAPLRLVELDAEESPEGALRDELTEWSGSPDTAFFLNGQPLGKGTHGLPAHLLAAYPCERAEQLRAAFEACGFPLTELGLDALSIVNAFEKCQPSWQDHLAALVKIDAPVAQVSWVREGVFAGHAVAFAPADADPLEPLSTELLRILKDGEGLCGADPSDCRAVFLCGEQGNDTGVASRLGAQLRADVQAMDAFAHTPFPSLEGNTQQIAEIAPQCAAALGMALSLAEGVAR
jgi:Tfp pilus assembly PilM family ATPase